MSDDGEMTGDPRSSGESLSEAQLAAIENAFGEHDRMLTRLRQELAELREQPPATNGAAEPVEELEQRLTTIEARLDQQDQALRHVLQRLIAFFEREGPVEGPIG